MDVSVENEPRQLGHSQETEVKAMRIRKRKAHQELEKVLQSLAITKRPKKTLDEDVYGFP